VEKGKEKFRVKKKKETALSAYSPSRRDVKVFSKSVEPISNGTEGSKAKSVDHDEEYSVVGHHQRFVSSTPKQAED